MTIAQRSGFHDLREAAVAAAKPLDYKPKRADNFDAKITEIQHFYKEVGLFKWKPIARVKRFKKVVA